MGAGKKGLGVEKEEGGGVKIARSEVKKNVPECRGCKKGVMKEKNVGLNKKVTQILHHVRKVTDGNKLRTYSTWIVKLPCEFDDLKFPGKQANRSKQCPGRVYKRVNAE